MVTINSIQCTLESEKELHEHFEEVSAKDRLTPPTLSPKNYGNN